MNGKAILPGGNSASLKGIPGQPIAEYTHIKSGTVHKLAGPENAKNFVFKATGNFDDGDTWTLNNKPITVTYSGGEELLPTAVLTGDVVQAILDSSHLRLMLQKPIPQESLSDNGNFEINQKNQEIYTGEGYAVNRWRIHGTNTKAEVIEDGIKITTTQPTRLNIFFQTIEVKKHLIGKKVTFTVELGDSSNGADFRLQAYDSNNSFLSEVGQNIDSNSVKTITLTVPKNAKFFQCVFRPAVYGQETFFVIKRTKLEPGAYFTGWPFWNYAMELAKCQRYQFCLSGDFPALSATGANLLSVFVALPVTMRKTPVCRNVVIDSLVVDGQQYEASDFTYNAVFNDKNHTHFIINFAPKITLPRGKAGSMRLESILLDSNL